MAILWTKIPQVLEVVNRDGVLPASVVTGFTSANHGATVSYRGKNGRTALALLEQGAKVQTVRNSPLQVVSINDRAADDERHWVFSVDGIRQTAAPDEFITRDGQTITWTLVE